eukprot:s2369_g7.t1
MCFEEVHPLHSFMTSLWILLRNMAARLLNASSTDWRLGCPSENTAPKNGTTSDRDKGFPISDATGPWVWGQVISSHWVNVGLSWCSFPMA